MGEGEGAYNKYGMRLFREIANLLAEEEISPFRVQYTVIDGRGGLFQNVRRLEAFSEEEIVLAGRRGKLRVTGSGLTLGKCSAGDVAVRGNIRRVEREDEQR